VAQRVVTETTYAPTTVAPVAEYVEPVPTRHPGLIPLALSSLLGLLSLFLPFWTHTGSFVREWLAPNYAGTGNATGDLLYQRFTTHSSGSFWNLSQGIGSHHTFLLILLALALLLALVAAFAGGAAGWARSLAGVLGILSGLYLLWKGFTHGGLGGWLAEAGRAAFGSGIGRWLMVLAGLGLLATGLWSLLGKVRDAASDVVGTTTYNN
jgi:hypothetical protein